MLTCTTVLVPDDTDFGHDSLASGFGSPTLPRSPTFVA